MTNTLIALFVVSTLLVLFQNCEQQLDANTAAEKEASEREVVQEKSSDYVQVGYWAGLDGDRSEKVFLDLKKGTMTLTAQEGQEITCSLPDEIKQGLLELLTDVEICTPAPLGPDEYACMAIGVPDIELFLGDGNSIWLQPEICRTGKFLCGDKDEQLRNLLRDFACE